MQNTNYTHEIAINSCYDALNYLDMILCPNSLLSVYKLLDSSVSLLGLDTLLKKESKKYGSFKLSWNFKKWQQEFEQQYKTTIISPQILAFFATKFQDKITSAYFESDNMLDIVQEDDLNYQLKVKKSNFYYNKISLIELNFQKLLHHDLIKTNAKKPDIYNFIQLLDTIQSTLQRLKSKKNQEVVKKKSHFGSAKGMIKMSADFDEPLSDFDNYMQ